MTMHTSLYEKLECDGFAVVPNVISEHEIIAFKQAVSSFLHNYPAAGIRGIAQKVPKIQGLAASNKITSLVQSVLGKQVQLIRSVLFNKSAEVNWKVPWHQDLSIAVRSQHEVERFSGWSEKEGIPHVQPPESVLQKMLTVRIHLDPADETNGAVWISPGSHKFGRLPANQAADTAKQQGTFLCKVNAGDILLFRPLTLHASSKSETGVPRRIIHLEYASVTLPSPLMWNEAA